MTNPTDKLGREIRTGDQIAVAHCEIDGDAYLTVAQVLEVRDDAVLETLEDAYHGQRGRRRTTRRASDVIVTPRDPDQMIEQFLPTGTTFTARYLPGGSYDFVVLEDGTIQDHEGDNATMDGIDLTSLHSVMVPHLWQ